MLPSVAAAVPAATVAQLPEAAAAAAAIVAAPLAEQTVGNEAARGGVRLLSPVLLHGHLRAS